MPPIAEERLLSTQRRCRRQQGARREALPQRYSVLILSRSRRSRTNGILPGCQSNLALPRSHPLSAQEYQPHSFWRRWRPRRQAPRFGHPDLEPPNQLPPLKALGLTNYWRVEENRIARKQAKTPIPSPPQMSSTKKRTEERRTDQQSYRPTHWTGVPRDGPQPLFTSSFQRNHWFLTTPMGKRGTPPAAARPSTTCCMYPVQHRHSAESTFSSPT